MAVDLPAAAGKSNRLILAVDTAQECGSIALADGQDLLEEVPLQGSDGFSQILFPQLQSLLNRHGLKSSDIALFAGAAGPGSFTGVRVTLACVKGLAEACHRPVIAVSNLEALADYGVSPLRAALSDARRGAVYSALYGQSSPRCSTSLTEILPERVQTVPEFLNRLAAYSHTRSPADSNVPVELLASSFDLFDAALREHLATVPGAFIKTEVPREHAAAIARIAWRRLCEGRVETPASIDANYVRRSDAEMFWHDR